MQLIGCLLLLSGFLLVVAALVLLSSQTERAIFLLAALAVEVLGLALLTQGYRLRQKGSS